MPTFLSKVSGIFPGVPVTLNLYPCKIHSPRTNISEQVCHETIFGLFARTPFSTNIGLNGRLLAPNLVDLFLL